MMNLELLANELLLDVFEYCSAIQLLRAFYGINKRLDNLIFIYFQKHRMDFRAVSKRDFEFICQHVLPLITDRIVSIGLSDDDETPEQIHLFRSYGWNFNQFPYLRSLSLDHIRSGEQISEILFECHHITHLKLIACYFGRKQEDIFHLMNCIWNLSKLIYCYIDIDIKNGYSILTPTNISLTIEYLSIVGVLYHIDHLIHLCEHTPCLRYLALELFCILNDKVMQTSVLSITELNLVFIGPQRNSIENLLQHMPNLYKLKIETSYVKMDGYEWEQIICNYSPKLKVFQLKMKFPVIGEKRKNELLNSFQTRFWIEEHQWFIRYHYNSDENSNMICLYTLPYYFSYFNIHFPLLFKSTSLNDDNYYSYDRVQHLLYRFSSNEEMIVSNLNFPNITSLSVELPVNNHLLSIVRRCDRLMSLEVSRSCNISDTDAQLQLQALLDQTSYLDSLKFDSWPKDQHINQKPSIDEKLTPVIIKTRLIRRVNLFDYDQWFNDEECIQISNSSLGIHCEVLYIKVGNRKNISYLINSMSKLRALIVRSRDDEWLNYLSSTEDQLVHWLQQNLSPTCSIKRDSRYIHHIRIWIQNLSLRYLEDSFFS